MTLFVLKISIWFPYFPRMWNFKTNILCQEENFLTDQNLKGSVASCYDTTVRLRRDARITETVHRIFKSQWPTFVSLCCCCPRPRPWPRLPWWLDLPPRGCLLSITLTHHRLTDELTEHYYCCH